MLRAAGVDPQVTVSDVDEDAILARLSEDAPATVVAALAQAKARRVTELLDAEVRADCVVVGCDSMLEVDGALAGKPGSVDAARRRWQASSGRTGMLHTGHSVLRMRAGAVVDEAHRTGSTAVHFGTPAADDLEAYLAGGEPLHVAGGFTIDGRGGWFIDRIEGDPSNVIGLSLPLLRKLLAGMGISVADLWRANSVRH